MPSRFTAELSARKGLIISVPAPKGAYRVVGSLPFGRTADIVRRLTQGACPPEQAHLVLQAEAAGRFLGRPFGPESLASLLLKPWWHGEVVWRLRRNDFDPPPRVDAVFAWLLRRERPLVSAEEEKAFRSFAKQVFGGRGRSVRECLAGMVGRASLEREASALGFDPRQRPSEIDFTRWLALFRCWRGLDAPSLRLPRWR